MFDRALQHRSAQTITLEIGVADEISQRDPHDSEARPARQSNDACLDGNEGTDFVRHLPTQAAGASHEEAQAITSGDSRSAFKNVGCPAPGHRIVARGAGTAPPPGRGPLNHCARATTRKRWP